GYLGMFSRSFGLSTLALRYSHVYGPYQDGTGEAGVVAITCDRLLSGRPPELPGDGQQTRDLGYVGDVAHGNHNALNPRGTGARHPRGSRSRSQRGSRSARGIGMRRAPDRAPAARG